MRRRLAVAQVLALAFLPVVLAAQSKALKLVSTAWAPFTNTEGQPRFSLDLVEAALGRAHVGSMTTMVAPDEFSAKLISGDYDGSAAAWRDPVREHVLLFSRPYLENRLVLVGRHGADVSAAALTALKGKRVAIVDGFSYGPAVEGSGPAWVRTAGEEDSIDQLLKGTVDYTLMDELVVRYLSANHPQEAASRLQIGTVALITRELCLAIVRTRRDAETLVNGFNTQIRNMVKDRTYHRLLHLDWISADVNGDGVPDYVPYSDRPGPAAPTHPYTLFSLPSGAAADYYIGGKVYGDWNSVPDSNKRADPSQPDPRRTTTLFKFVW
jgi:polar amino acid transport system substrate-binding protein